ncbi:MAG TPA: non-canonical purine NTP pyrophosphatase, RdgB/HAM1 family [Planctomycetes bacterium]|nr:non-canonical purine NTP pyrophosphatase, RdgB/HAM1 family [Planctomycetota bacterium]
MLKTRNRTSIMFVATGNRHKLREIAALLAPMRIEARACAELGDADIVEDGATFLANARTKLAAYAGRTDQWVLADDSGLEVPALGGAPGVNSARYARPHDDAANNAKLLAALASFGGAGRRARFVCAVALGLDGREVFATEGAVEGMILEAPRGGGGFGYDPLFFYPPCGATFAELSDRDKNRVSHRARALEAVAGFLRAHGAGER